ncbi:MAG: RNA-binding protein [Phycisphaerae bacterium]|nr:RNA-binding protein [Phycisphaerae bacterium]
MDIYVGNLSFDATEADLEHAFGAYGKVRSVNIVRDRFNGNPLGFAFVDMPADDEARCAIGALHKSRLIDRVITVSQTQRRAERRTPVDVDVEATV